MKMRRRRWLRRLWRKVIGLRGSLPVGMPPEQWVAPE